MLRFFVGLLSLIAVEPSLAELYGAQLQRGLESGHAAALAADDLMHVGPLCENILACGTRISASESFGLVLLQEKARRLHRSQANSSKTNVEQSQVSRAANGSSLLDVSDSEADLRAWPQGAPWYDALSSAQGGPGKLSFRVPLLAKSTAGIIQEQCILVLIVLIWLLFFIFLFRACVTGTGLFTEELTVFKQVVDAHGQDLTLSIRAGCGVSLLVMLQFLVIKPEEAVAAASDTSVKPSLQIWTPSMAGIAVFLFTFYRNIGETVCRVLSAYTGIIMAAFIMYILEGLMPDGLMEGKSTETFWMGATTAFLWVAFLFFFNWHTNAVIFGLATFAGLWIPWMDQRPDSFSKGFRINEDGLAVLSLLWCFAGGSLAIVLMVIPRPITALLRARKDCIAIMWELHHLFDELEEGMRADSELLCDIIGYFLRVETYRKNFYKSINAAWWECLGLGQHQRWRIKFQVLDKELRMMGDVLFASTCLLQHWLPSRDGAFVEALLDSNLVRTASKLQIELLQLCTDVLETGQSSPEEHGATLREAMAKLASAVEDLTTEFTSFRKAEREKEGSSESPELKLEHVFAYMVCSYCGKTLDLSEAILIDISSAEATEPAPTMLDVLNSWAMPFWNVFDPAVFVDLGHLKWAIKGSFSYLLALFAGLVGFKDALPARNPNMAVVVALLCTHSMQPSLSRSLERIQGVTLGFTTGYLLHAFVVQCSLAADVVMTAALFLLTLLSQLFYLNGSSHQQIAFLFGFFVVEAAVVLPCGGAEAAEKLGKTTSFDLIIHHLAAVIIVSVTEVIISGSRSSEMAMRACVECLSILRFRFSAILGHSSASVLPEEGTNVACLHLRYAIKLRKEVENEELLWSQEWPAAYYSKLLERMTYMLCLLRGLEWKGASLLPLKPGPGENLPLLLQLESSAVQKILRGSSQRKEKQVKRQPGHTRKIKHAAVSITATLNDALSELAEDDREADGEDDIASLIEDRRSQSTFCVASLLAVVACLGEYV